MVRQRHFLNFEVDEELLVRLDEAAEKSDLDRSKQARALIEYALGGINILDSRAYYNSKMRRLGMESNKVISIQCQYCAF